MLCVRTAAFNSTEYRLEPVRVFIRALCVVVFLSTQGPRAMPQNFHGCPRHRPHLYASAHPNLGSPRAESGHYVPECARLQPDDIRLTKCKCKSEFQIYLGHADGRSLRDEVSVVARQRPTISGPEAHGTLLCRLPCNWRHHENWLSKLTIE
jgi:hypothetical protein